jgi:hypothetical protein
MDRSASDRVLPRGKPIRIPGRSQPANFALSVRSRDVRRSAKSSCRVLGPGQVRDRWQRVLLSKRLDCSPRLGAAVHGCMNSHAPLRSSVISSVHRNASSCWRGLDGNQPGACCLAQASTPASKKVTGPHAHSQPGYHQERDANALRTARSRSATKTSCARAWARSACRTVAARGSSECTGTHCHAQL